MYYVWNRVNVIERLMGRVLWVLVGFMYGSISVKLMWG